MSESDGGESLPDKAQCNSNKSDKRSCDELTGRHFNANDVVMQKEKCFGMEARIRSSPLLVGCIRIASTVLVVGNCVLYSLTSISLTFAHFTYIQYCHPIVYITIAM